jgi:hypothetical protein
VVGVGSAARPGGSVPFTKQYYLERARETRLRASVSSDRGVRGAHWALAHEYERRAAKIAPDDRERVVSR